MYLYWKTVFESYSLPSDVYSYLIKHFYLPFVVGERENRKICHYMGLSIKDDVADEEILDFLSNCSTTLILDDRINDHKEDVLFRMMRKGSFCEILPLAAKIFIIENALRTDNVAAFRYFYRHHRFLEISRMEEFLLRQSFRLIIDPFFRKHIRESGPHFIDMILETAFFRNYVTVVERILILLPYFYHNKPWFFLGRLELPCNQKNCDLIRKYESYLGNFFELKKTYPWISVQ